MAALPICKSSRAFLDQPVTPEQQAEQKCTPVCNEKYLRDVLRLIAEGKLTEKSFKPNEWATLTLLRMITSGTSHRDTFHHKGNLCGTAAFLNASFKAIDSKGVPVIHHGAAAAQQLDQTTGGHYVVPDAEKDKFVRHAVVCSSCHTTLPPTTEQSANATYIPPKQNPLDFCTSCHGRHDIIPPGIDLSELEQEQFHPEADETCHTCHDKQKNTKASHAQEQEVCKDCHE